MAKATQQSQQPQQKQPEQPKQIVVTPPQGNKPAEVSTQTVQPQQQMQQTTTQGQQVELKVMPGVTAENFTTFTKEALIQGYGNKSNAIRGLNALGIKAGPISKHLNIRYQHARNVLQRPLKRQIAEERNKNSNIGGNQNGAK